ncbi:MAG: hypothetical protein J7J51_05420 [Candidatus Omnitrophica bacterium]|nr:hypothetical protein [Candidatus Omnitrophota bacterium]
MPGTRKEIRDKNKPVTKSDLKKVETELKKEIREVEVKLSRRIDKVESRLDKVESRLDKVERSIDILASQVAENTVRLDNMVTREEFKHEVSKLVDGQDKMITILQRLDQERIFTNQRLKRVEEVVFK